MKFFVIKGKYLLVSVFVFIFLFVFITTGGISPVFKVGNREIPIYSVKREDEKVALTFNCAWGDEDIDTILKTLDAYGVKSTFFIVGTWGEKYPERVKQIKEAGHEIGNHSYNHAHYNNMRKSEIIRDIEKCDSVLYEITNEKPVFVRAGYGEYNDDVVSACDESGRYYIQWSVDSIDYGDATENEIYERVVSKTENGSIILMHTGTKNTKNALPSILSELTKKYNLCTVGELIYKDNYIIDATGMQIKTA